MNLFQIIKIKFFGKKETIPEFDRSEECEKCIIGNIVDKHFYGSIKEIRRGTKHFRPNTKVYCLPEFPGMAHETMVVVGLHRKSKRLIKIAIPTKRVKNFRLKNIYKPVIIGHIKENWFYEGWRREKPYVNDVQEFIAYLNSLTEEVE